MILTKFSKLHEAITKTKRVGIQHLNKMKPMDFLNLVKVLKDELGGKISDSNASVTLKVDGFGCRFGLDADNGFFLESSNSGPQYKPKSFSQYTINRKGKADKISIAYDELFDSLSKNKKLISVLKKNNTDSGIKIVSECLYAPIGKKDKGTIKFVAINYDSAKLGKIATLVLIKAQDGHGTELKGSVIKDIKGLSTNDYLFTDPSTSIDSVDLNVQIQDVLKFVSKYPDFEQKILSRKHADRELKTLLQDTIAGYQEKMSKKILKAIVSAKFGSEFEGIVIKLSNGTVFKTIHSDFSNAIKHRPKG